MDTSLVRLTCQCHVNTTNFMLKNITRVPSRAEQSAHDPSSIVLLQQKGLSCRVPFYVAFSNEAFTRFCSKTLARPDFIPSVPHDTRQKRSTPVGHVSPSIAADEASER